MLLGAIIEKGPQDWKIIQQNNGFGSIQLSGRWYFQQEPEQPAVYIRIVSEDNGESIIPWKMSNLLSDNKWEITIQNIPAGGLYRIETCVLNNSNTNFEIEDAVRGDMVHHIGIGDVYVIAGQSNSAGYGEDSVYDPPELGIHVLRNNGNWGLASHPLNDSTNTVHEINRDLKNTGHSPYLSFAKFLKRDLGYPIGLIQTSLGGSALRMWNPFEEGSLYKNMISIIDSQGGDVKGILWYQGCGDGIADRCNTYSERFIQMVGQLRKDMNNDNLPVVTVQLNRRTQPSNADWDSYWGKVREAQRQVAGIISNVFVVPSIDCSLCDFIHNSSLSNIRLGERIAKLILSELYGKNYLCKAPNIKRAEKHQLNQVVVEFENIYGRIYTFEVEAGSLPFTFFDDKGQVTISGYEIISKNEILFSLERSLKGKCIINGAYEWNPKTPVPIDRATHIPMLAFYGVEVRG